MVLTEEEEHLFENLRGLRAEIAREEKVPPYIVFSDKTLVFMSRIKPKNREEMLQVTGVGEYKLERYGLRFWKRSGKPYIDRPVPLSIMKSNGSGRKGEVKC